MRSLDVEVEGLVEVPSGTDVFDAFAVRKGCPPAVVEAHRIRCRRADFAPIVCNEYTGDHRPGARMGRRFAGEVPCVELGDGGVEVVGIEHDACHEPFVGVDLDDVESDCVEPIRALGMAPYSDAIKDEARATDRNNL